MTLFGTVLMWGEEPYSDKTGNGILFGFVHIEDGVQLGELQQVGHLAAGIGEFQLAPGLPLVAAALRAGLPLAIVILEHRRAAGSADRLSDGAQRHDQFTETAAVDVGDIFKIEQNPGVPLRDFVANRIAESRQRVACSDSSRQDRRWKLHRLRVETISIPYYSPCVPACLR